MTLHCSERKSRPVRPRAGLKLNQEAQGTPEPSTTPKSWVHRRRNIAVVSASGPTVEDSRRALRALGRSPWIFMSIDELQSLGSRLRQFELLVFVESASLETTDQEDSPASQVRKVMGEGVPVLLAFEGRAPASLVLVQDINTGVASGPFTFSRFYILLHDFAVRHRIRLDPAAPEWGPYRFHARTHSVSFGSDEVRLAPCEFDLAIELFYSVDRVVPTQRLDFIVEAHGSAAEKTALHARIAGLRNALDFDITREWQIESVAGVGYRLLAPAVPGPERRTLGGRSGFGTK